MRVTVSPRYGRDYVSAADAKAAFMENKDFTVESGSHSGAAINKADCLVYGIKFVVIRYAKRMRATEIEL